MTFKVISLFSGIGGLDLGFERAGFEIVAQVETDKFCRKVLRKHWPNVALYEDVRHVGKRNLPDAADVIMGGFPCQDISIAGKRQGIKEGTRSGLWLEFARIIGELRPRVVLLENVPAITTLDGTTVIADLAALGYDAEWGIVAASDVGAPHRRERWFCVAYPRRGGQFCGAGRVGSDIRDTNGNAAPDQSDGQRWINGISETGSVVNAQRIGRERQREDEQPDAEHAPLARTGDYRGARLLADTQKQGLQGDGSGSDDYRGSYPAQCRERTDCRFDRCDSGLSEQSHGATQSGMGRIFDGLPGWLDGIRRDSRWPARPGEAQAEWEASRTVTGKVKDRANRIKALGNAVVPQVAYAMALVVRAFLEKAEVS